MVTLRSSSLRLRFGRALKKTTGSFISAKAAPACGIFLSVIGFLYALIYLIAIGLPALGLGVQQIADSIFGSGGPAFYSQTLAKASPEAWREGLELLSQNLLENSALSSRDLSYLSRRPEEAQKIGSALFGFNAPERSALLKHIAKTRLALQAAQAQQIAPESLDAVNAVLLARMIRQGESLDKAIAAIKASNPRASPQSKALDAQLAALGKLSAMINSAAPAPLASLSFGRSFFPWRDCELCFFGMGAAPSASPLQWAGFQANAIRSLPQFMIGLMTLLIFIGLIILIAWAYELAMQAVNDKQDELFTEWESQSVRRSTNKPNASTPSKRL